MYAGDDWYLILQKIYTNMIWQSEKIEEYEKLLTQIQQDLTYLKENKKQNMVDKIEYNFDQLKVETLEGTLNVGITPGSSGQIEDTNVTSNFLHDMEIKTKQFDPFSNIQNQVYTFLEQEALPYIQHLEKEYNFILGEEYHQEMIDDIKQQVDDRIRYYVNQANTNDASLSSQTIVPTITEKVKKDIFVAIENHVNNLPRKDDGVT